MDDAELWAETIPTGDPYALFDAWLAEARACEPNDPEAMALATATPAGAPSVRMVLLKEHGAKLGGFVFYTNAHSRKGAEIAANPQVSLLFHWKTLRRQVRIEGRAEPVAAAMSDAYFASRARDSRLGAIASDQSAPMASRGEFLARYDAVAERYADTEPPRPAHWHGWLVAPERIEFWVDRRNRLHERRVFAADGSSRLLYP